DWDCAGIVDDGSRRGLSGWQARTIVEIEFNLRSSARSQGTLAGIGGPIFNAEAAWIALGTAESDLIADLQLSRINRLIQVVCPVIIDQRLERFGGSGVRYVKIPGTAVGDVLVRWTTYYWRNRVQHLNGLAARN